MSNTRNMSLAMDRQHFDLFGIGIGPFNLSIAALAHGIEGVKTGFADIHPKMTWHPGLLLNDARMQTSPFKDMVTAVDPTSPLSFLSYLVSKKKIYAFMAAQMQTISRIEFADYLAWVAEQLDGLMFDNPVEAVEFVDNKFVIHSRKGILTSQHLCLGTGKRPHAPDCAKPHLGDSCLHASELGLKPRNFQGKTIAVVGGGQTGADVFLNLLKFQWGEPARVIWISRRPNFQALDEGVFTDQYFTPEYGELFYDLDASIKAREVKQQKLASDGITSTCLNEIYQHLYQQHFINNNRQQWCLRPHRTLVAMDRCNALYRLKLEHGLHGEAEMLDVDQVVLCTGFESRLPQCLQPIKDRISINDSGQFQLNRDFSIDWDGPAANKVFAVNAGIHSHGIIEPQLSLSAWRSAKIINSFLGFTYFDIESEPSMIDWGMTSSMPQATAV